MQKYARAIAEEAAKNSHFALQIDATFIELLESCAPLHDVGKIECGLGTFGRVVATLVGPRTAAFTAYHDHEDIGAAMAKAVGSDPATVELIAQRGPAFDALEASDHA